MACPSINPYGKTQSWYLEKTEIIVNEGCRQLAQQRKEGIEPQKIFFKLLDHLAGQRYQMAEEQGTDEANLFGKQRKYSICDTHWTLLSRDGGSYKGWNDRLLSYFAKFLKGKIPDSGALRTKKFKREEEHEGRKCTFEVELLTQADLEERQWHQNLHSDFPMIVERGEYKLNPEYMKIDQINFTKGRATQEETALLNEYHTTRQNFKRKYPDVYLHGKMNTCLTELHEKFPPPLREQIWGTIVRGDENNAKGIFVLGKVRMEIDGKLYALTQYLTWTHQREKKPIEQMKKSVVMIIHQDIYLVDPTLQAISKLFKRALEWQKAEGIEELEKRVGHIRYLLSHAMPCMRGSAAISDWLEGIIYRDRGYEMRRIEGTSADQEAFVAPLLPEFMKKYRSTFLLSEKV